MTQKKSDGILDLKIDQIEDNFKVLRIDLSDHKKKIVQIRLDLSELKIRHSIVEKLVFGAVGIILIEIISAGVLGAAYFISK